MHNRFYQEGRDSIKELIRQYENLKKGIKHQFIDEDSFERIVNYYEERDNLANALEAVDIATEQYPYSGALLVKKADLLLTMQQYNDALEILEQATIFDSGDPNIVILKTEAYLALDQQDKAVEVLENVLASLEGDEKLELLFELSDVYDDYEEFDKVFDCLKVILEIDPNNDEALFKICFWTDFTGRNEESIRLHNEIIDNYPYNELAWFNLASAYQGLKLYEKSIDAYLYAIAIEDKFDYAYRNMADAYIRLHNYKEAIEALEKVTELSKPEAVICEAIGHCYDKMKKYGQARFYYKKASHLDMEDSRLIYKLASTYYNELQWKNCIRVLDGALNMQPGKPEYNLMMGNAKMKLGQNKEALKYLSVVVGCRPKNVAAWEALLHCLINGKYYEEALGQVDITLKVTMGKPVFLFYKSAILFLLQRNNEAAESLETALKQAPGMVKKLVQLIPGCLQNQQVLSLIIKYKKGKNLK